MRIPTVILRAKAFDLCATNKHKFNRTTKNCKNAQKQAGLTAVSSGYGYVINCDISSVVYHTSQCRSIEHQLQRKQQTEFGDGKHNITSLRSWEPTHYCLVSSLESGAYVASNVPSTQLDLSAPRQSREFLLFSSLLLISREFVALQKKRFQLQAIIWLKHAKLHRAEKKATKFLS